MKRADHEGIEEIWSEDYAVQVLIESILNITITKSIVMDEQKLDDGFISAYDLNVTGYQNALNTLLLESLRHRRKTKCLGVELKYLFYPITSFMFPANPQLEHSMNTRH